MFPPPPASVWDHQFASLQRPAVPWIWTGFLAKGRVTLLTSMWKSGKTTLLSLLLSRRKQVGLLGQLCDETGTVRTVPLPTCENPVSSAIAQGTVPVSSQSLLGQPVFPGATAVVSEEDVELWRPRAEQLDFGGRACFKCQPFDGKPNQPQWLALIEQLLGDHQAHGIDLVVIDTLASLLPTRNENNAASMLDAILPLRALTRAGIALLLMHHPRKGETTHGQAARGSGALPAFVDLFLEMNLPPGDPATRRRIITGFSRFRETPRRLLIELNPDATDYNLLPDPQAEEFQTQWHVLRMVFEDAKGKLTRRQILKQWPRDFPQPSDATLRRWLTDALGFKYLETTGTGRRSNPFRYWLPEKQKEWEADPLYFLTQQAEEIQKLKREGLLGPT